MDLSKDWTVAIEKPCEECSGTKRVNDRPCTRCVGTGRITSKMTVDDFRRLMKD